MATGSDDVRLARALLQALEQSSGGSSSGSLTAEERSELLSAVLQATKEAASAGGVEAAPLDLETAGANEVQRAVEASFLCLRERLTAGGAGQEECLEEVVAWVERSALPVLRSGRPDLQATCDYIGTQAIARLAELGQGSARVQACFEEAALVLLDDVASSRGPEESAAVLAARVRWIAAFLTARADPSAAPVPPAVIERCLLIMWGHTDASARATFVLNICASLAELLNKGGGLAEELWRTIVELGEMDDVDHQRDAHAMLCILHGKIRAGLTDGQQLELWRLLYRGLNSSECSAIRKRALYVLGLELERVAEQQPAARGQAAVKWWMRYLQVFDTLENVGETHLLHQVYPAFVVVVEEACAEGGGSEEDDGGSGSASGARDPATGLPLPSRRWAEALMARSLALFNYTVRRIYLLWIIAQGASSLPPQAPPAAEAAAPAEQQGQHEQPRLDIRRLSQAFVLGRLLPALDELNSIRDDREGLMRNIGQFMAKYLVGAEERGGAREWLWRLLTYCKDSVKSSLVRLALLGSIEQLGATDTVAPCFEEAELQLAAQLVAAVLGENNQSVGHPLAGLVFAFCERFTDFASVRASPTGPETVRALVLELPLQLSLLAQHDRVASWLRRFDDGGTASESGGGGGGSWWLEATLRGAEALLAAPGQPDGAPSPSCLSVALAYFFLDRDHVAIALAPCVDILGRIHSHPYLAPPSRRAALQLLRALGALLKTTPNPAVHDALRPCMAETFEFLAAALRPSAESSNDDSSSSPQPQFEIEVLGIVVWLASDMGPVASSILGLVDACAEMLASDAEAQGTATPATVRALLVLCSVLENLARRGALQREIAARFQLLKRGLDAAAARRPAKADASRYPRALWRSRALVYKMKASADAAAGAAARSDLEEEVPGFLPALEVASVDSLLDVLFCISCFIEPYVLAPHGDKRARLDGIVHLALHSLEEGSYLKRLTQLCIDMVVCPAFLSDPELCGGAESPVRVFFTRLVEVGCVKKGHILVDLAARFIMAWRRVLSAEAVSLAAFFVDPLVTLLTVREVDEDIHHLVDAEDQDAVVLMGQAKDGQRSSTHQLDPPVIRMAVLFFLCELFEDPRQRPLLDKLVVALFECAAAVNLRKSQIKSTPAFSVKLRAWQALAVLSRFVAEDTLPDVTARLHEAMGLVTLPQIRWHMEMFMARLCMMYPRVCLTQLVERVSVVDMRPQVSASLLVVVGLVCLSEDSLFEGGRLPDEFVVPLLKAVLPWLSGTHVTTRVICQMVAFRLVSLVLEGGLMPRGVGSLDRAYLEGTLAFLRDNREMSLLRQKEMRKFAAVSVGRSCTVAGVMAHNVVDGDFSPRHLEESLREGMTELILQIEEEEGWSPSASGPGRPRRDLFDFNPDVDSARSMMEAADSETYAIQRKIVISDLLTGMPKSEQSRSTNARGQPLQDICICASLLDRLPNLAGLARTCEIFAASRLAIPDLRVVKDPLFQSISSSAASWVALEQVRDVDTLAYLRRMKREGYVVVGLEQTSTSQSLVQVQLPRRMVLLLGREREGVPVELLAEVDMLVEIPQLGLVRSLNVHVSASLIIWEYTRQHRFGAKAKAACVE